MADAKLYLRPIWFLYGPPAEAALAEGLELPLAGGPIAFTAGVLIEGTPRKSTRRLVAADALNGARDTDLKALLKRVTTKRRLAAAPFEGG